MPRCEWAEGDPALRSYHDLEWGVPLHDDRALFELLTLEGAQAGLSWITVLRRREGYRRAFANFDPATVAAFGDAELRELLANPKIIRNRQKIASTVENARQIVRLQQEVDGGSFDRLVWSFVNGVPQVHRLESMGDLPAQTTDSVALSKALRKQGFGFVGPTICYAFMQAAGLVNDHFLSCPRWAELA